MKKKRLVEGYNGDLILSEDVRGSRGEVVTVKVVEEDRVTSVAVNVEDLMQALREFSSSHKEP